MTEAKKISPILFKALEPDVFARKIREAIGEMDAMAMPNHRWYAAARTIVCNGYECIIRAINGEIEKIRKESKDDQTNKIEFLQKIITVIRDRRISYINVHLREDAENITLPDIKKELKKELGYDAQSRAVALCAEKLKQHTKKYLWLTGEKVSKDVHDFPVENLMCCINYIFIGEPAMHDGRLGMDSGYLHLLRYLEKFQKIRDNAGSVEDLSLLIDAFLKQAKFVFKNNSCFRKRLLAFCKMHGKRRVMPKGTSDTHSVKKSM